MFDSWSPNVSHCDAPLVFTSIFLLQISKTWEKPKITSLKNIGALPLTSIIKIFFSIKFATKNYVLIIVTLNCSHCWNALKVEFHLFTWARRLSCLSSFYSQLKFSSKENDTHTHTLGRKYIILYGQRGHIKDCNIELVKFWDKRPDDIWARWMECTNVCVHDLD